MVRSLTQQSCRPSSVSWREVQLHKRFLADDIAQCPKGKIGDQYKKYDHAGCNDLIPGPACDITDRIQNRPAMNGPDDSLLDNVQDDQKDQEGKRSIERRQNQRGLGDTPSDVECASQKHELGADDGLDGGQTKRCEKRVGRVGIEAFNCSTAVKQTKRYAMIMLNSLNSWITRSPTESFDWELLSIVLSDLGSGRARRVSSLFSKYEADNDTVLGRRADDPVQVDGQPVG